MSGEEATSADVERSLVDRDLARKIMAGVPDDMQASVWLRHVDGMSHQEVGANLGLSRRTIFNHLDRFHRRAQRFLRAEIQVSRA